MRAGGLIFQSALAAVLVAATPSAAPAQEDQQPQTVVEIRVEGNQQVPQQSVLAYVRTRVGEECSDQIISADKTRLLESGRFSSVVVTKTQTDKGVVVTFVVVERPLVAKLTFYGNKAFKDAELAKVLSFGEMGPLARFAVEKGRRDLLRKYKSGGYYFVTVEVDPEAMGQRHVLYRIIEGPKVHIRKLRFEGNTAFSGLRLRQEVSVAQRLWPFIAGTLDTEEVESSVTALRALYVREGYLDAEVGRQMSFSDDKRAVTLTFVIKEGQRYRVNEVLFEGNQVFSDEALGARLTLRQGGFFSALRLARDVKAVQDAYGEIGYIEVQVDAGRIFLSPEAPPPAWAAGVEPKPALLNLRFRLVEGGQFKVGQVTIRGNTVTQERVIRREVRSFPGQWFNILAIEESRRRLVETQLFEKVDILRVGQAPGVRDIVIHVDEARTAHFLVGVGVSSSSGVLGSVSYRQRNFDLFGWPKSWKEFAQGESFKGAGQTLSIVAEPGTEFMRFHVDWFEPYLFDQPYSLGTRAFLFDRGRESYDETRYGGLVSLGHRFRNRWYGEVAARIEGVNVGDIDAEAPPEVRKVAGTSAFVGLKGTLVRDRTNSRWAPSTGDRFQASYEQVVGDFTFGRVVGDYHIYRTVHVDALGRRHIVAGRVSLGQILGEAPVFERFYGGGIGSIRGFKYRGISPRSRGTDEAIGGDTMIFAGCEYTFPLIGKPDEGEVRGVVFLDSGTVEEDFSITTYRASAGVGIRWTVPFFGPIPISLDFGFPLSKDAQDETQVFSFSLGWVF